jgi:hypothetical protein
LHDRPGEELARTLAKHGRSRSSSPLNAARASLDDECEAGRGEQPSSSRPSVAQLLAGEPDEHCLERRLLDADVARHPELRDEWARKRPEVELALTRAIQRRTLYASDA